MESSLLWFAFQPNAFTDLSESSREFPTALLRMKENLKNKGFHLASLASNMRSTREISKIQLNRDVDYGHSMQEHITKLKSSIAGKLPEIILINKRDQDSKLKDAFYDVLNITETSNSANWTLLHASNFSSYDIEKQLIKAGIQHNIQIYAGDKNETDNLKSVEHFLQNDTTLLVVEAKYFTGCETPNILYLLSDDGLTGAMTHHTGDSNRCTMLRAVERISIIYLFDDYNDFKFEGVCRVTKYLNCENEIGYYHYACKPCRLSHICTSCEFSCHHGHTLERLFEKPAKCECQQHDCKIINKAVKHAIL